MITKRMDVNNEGISHREDKELCHPNFYLADYGIINFNWDMIGLWPMMTAHKEINHQNGHDFSRKNTIKQLRIYNDFAQFMSCKKHGANDQVWYPFNEAVAVRFNKESHGANRHVVLVKTYFPHGLTNWLHCPKCGKLTMFLGKTFELGDKKVALSYEEEYSCQHCEHVLHL